MKRKALKFKIDKSISDEIMELLANYDCQNFYSESYPNDDFEVFHLFCDDKAEEVIEKIKVPFELEWVEDEDWIKKWSESLKIVNVGNNLYVNPNPSKFKDPQEGITVKIVPGMAFGTGHYEVRKNNLMDGIDESFDIVVANIYYEVIIKLLDQLSRGIVFIVSGIDKSHEKDMEQACIRHGMTLIDKACEGEWCGFVFSW